MKIKMMLILMLTVPMLLSACRSDAADAISGDITVYDIDEDTGSLVEAGYTFDRADGDLSDHVGELLQRLIDGPDGDRKMAAVPPEISAVTYSVQSQTVNVNFDGSFPDVSYIRRLICQAAVVRTLCGLDDIYAVSFSVNAAPVTGKGDEPVGLLSAESFTAPDGSTLLGYEKAELYMYFANASGDRLVARTETVTYNAHTAPDRVVVENLIKGPKNTDVFKTLDPSTKINSVTTRNGICYVNLGKGFLNKKTNVTDEVMLYSLVNSLTQLESVNKVKILIDGKEDIRLGEFDLSDLYERNLEMIE